MPIIQASIRGCQSSRSVTSIFQSFYVDVGQGVGHGEKKNCSVVEVQIRITIVIQLADFTEEKKPIKTPVGVPLCNAGVTALPYQSHFS